MEAKPVSCDPPQPPKMLSNRQASRVSAVLESGIIGSERQSDFDSLCAIAAECTGSPIALITILDDKRQWFKASYGTELVETPVEWSFCQHALEVPDNLLVINNALENALVCDSPLVKGELGIRAYMGAPLVSAEGHVFGTLCVIDTKVRLYSDQQQLLMKKLGILGSGFIDSFSAIHREKLQILEQSEQELQRVVMLLTYGLDMKAYIDLNGHYQYVNRAFLERRGCSEREVLGRHVREVVGAEAYDADVAEPLRRALAGHAASFTRLTAYPNIGPRWMEASLFPALDGSGKVMGVVARARDVHDLVTMNRQLQEKTARQHYFVQMLAHDIREPIRTIRSFIQLGIEEAVGSLPVDSDTHFRIAQRGAARMSLLVDALLDFLKVDQTIATRDYINLADVALEAKEDLTHLAQSVRGDISVTLSSRVLGNATWIRVCLQNLISNGLKYRKPGVPPKVAVTESLDEDFTLVQVTDNGLGIPADKSDHIFQPFVRLASPQPTEGSGLGLSLCRKIAEFHGGSIELKKTGDWGSTFELRLPKS